MNVVMGSLRPRVSVPGNKTAARLSGRIHDLECEGRGSVYPPAVNLESGREYWRAQHMIPHPRGATHMAMPRHREPMPAIRYVELSTEDVRLRSVSSDREDMTSK